VGRPPTMHNGDYYDQVHMEWATLMEPESAQRHRTARLYENAFDDSVGWIEFERIA
jgi:hypothetical protein